jgi:hypothetical protein
MTDPQDLRDQAQQWRRQAATQTPAVAAQLIVAARQLEQQAADLELAEAAYPATDFKPA